jgi:hypothetical protein
MAKRKAPTEAPADNTFTVDGKKYKAIKSANVPMANGAVLMSAADIASDEKAQKYLVENKCSCVEEVIE